MRVRMCPVVLITVLMISANNAEKKCYFCEDSECLKSKPPTIIDCSKQKMSSMHLSEKAHAALDFLFKRPPEVDDPSEYTKCVRFEYVSHHPMFIWIASPPSYFSGCAPEMIGNDTYCQYLEYKRNPNQGNVSFYDCSLCEPADKDCLSYPLFFKKKTCFLCKSDECYEGFDEVDCTKVKMSSYKWTGRSKEMWDLLVAGAPELDDPTEYNSCVYLNWKNGAGKRGHIWSCAPDRVGKEEYCDYVRKTSTENNYTLLRCEICYANNYRPCNYVLDPPGEKAANCYLSQDPDELTPKRIMDCSTEKMSEMNLTGHAKDLWDFLSDQSYDVNEEYKYDRCFAMLWDHDGQSGFLSGCSPKIVSDNLKPHDLLEFCRFVDETAARKNYKISSCQTVRASEEPRFYKAWEKAKKCYRCRGYYCKEGSEIIVDCNEEKTETTSLWSDSDEKTLWNSLLTREMMNLSHNNKCFGLSWAENGMGKFRGCAPEYVNNLEFCDYVNQIATKVNLSHMRCHTCQATEEPCLKDWDPRANITREQNWASGKSNPMSSYDHHAVMWGIISGVLLNTML